MAEPEIRSYQDLTVWRTAMDLAEDCYRVTNLFPKDELYGMITQIRRSAASIAANIAEGHGRESTGAFIQSLRVAQGSLKELETHILLSQRIGYIMAEVAVAILEKSNELGRMLRALIRSLQRRIEVNNS